MDIGSTDLEFPYEDNADPSATDPQLNVLRFALPLAKGAQIKQGVPGVRGGRDQGQ